MDSVYIVMPAYNAENYIGEAIESVQAQTYQNWELHIVDDCSSDTTPEIARKYAETDSRITVWSSEKNSGVSAAKDSATYHAVEDAKSDALLGCMYKVTKTSKCFGIYKETKAEVRGFPADVKGIELVKDHPVLIEKDKQIVRLNSWESLGDKARTPKIESASKKSGLFSFLGF